MNIFIIFVIFSFPRFEISDLFHHCKYDETNQGIRNQAMQRIIYSEINGNHSLSFKEALIQEQ